MSDRLLLPATAGAARPAASDRPAPFTHSLRFKLGVTLAAAIAVGAALFASVIIQRTRAAFLDQAIEQNSQLAEVIRHSTRYAMLENHREQVAQIISAVSRTSGIEKIRILDKEGVVITSTLPAEVGTRVDKTAEACYHCHAAGRPLEQLPGKQRHRVYRSALGHRLLGTIDVIRNEPACSGARCHAHPESVKVLGVLDIAHSLEEMDRRERHDIIAIGGISAALMVVIFLAVGTLVTRQVYQPLADLEAGARRISQGDRGHTIPVRHHDEIGHLATSFNRMTEDLRRYERDLEEWALTLERKVEQKTGELRIAEAHAIHSEKLASVGLLAAGIAHEINNPLTGVLTFAHLVRARLAAGSTEQEDMDVIIRETKRCAAIIRRLLDFAREKKPTMALADLSQVILETIQLVEHQAGFQNVVFLRELDPALPPVWMDPDQIKQVFMNIVVNAKEAMAERGTLTARTSFLADGARGGGAAPGPAVQIIFADTGCGIPAADLPRIFDPFFTSKEPGRGVGLGLSVSYSIVRAHGGTIQVESEVGTGTTFRIVLPVNERTPGASETGGGNAG
jgi:two-component system NtrC family sensor kinase